MISSVSDVGSNAGSGKELTQTLMVSPLHDPDRGSERQAYLSKSRMSKGMRGSDVGGDVLVAVDLRPGDGDRGRGAAEHAARAHVHAWSDVGPSGVA